MELLDKGNFYASKIKECKKNMIWASSLIIGSVVFLTILTREMMTSFIIMFIAGFIFTNGILYYRLKQNESKLNHIDKMTDKFDEFTVRTQIISKSQESTTYVSGQQGYVSSSTSHLYMVGVRTESGYNLKLCSENLYMSAREGEYVDVLIKQKLDKNGNILDSSLIPLMNTIKESI